MPENPGATDREGTAIIMQANTTPPTAPDTTTQPAAANPVVPGTERWAELVQLGITKDADLKWFLGDAALEIAPVGAVGAPNGTRAVLQQYAGEIGVNFDTLQTYRTAAASWPPDTRLPGTAWSVHQKLMTHKDLIRPGMTRTAAAAALELDRALKDQAAQDAGAKDTGTEAAAGQGEPGQDQPAEPGRDERAARAAQVAEAADHLLRKLDAMLATDQPGRTLAYLEENSDVLPQGYRDRIFRDLARLGGRTDTWDARLRAAAVRRIGNAA